MIKVSQLAYFGAEIVSSALLTKTTFVDFNVRFVIVFLEVVVHEVNTRCGSMMKLKATSGSMENERTVVAIIVDRGLDRSKN